MFQLLVTFIRNHHNARQYETGFKVLLLTTQSVKDGDLQ